MNIPMLDLRGQYASLADELDAAVARVVRSQHFILGQEVEDFEQEIARYLGSRHALGVSSGTDALLLALMALGVAPGDEVILPTFSFFATAGVVARLGARPVFVDIDPQTYNIDPDRIAEKIGERTAAIVPVHLFGQGADLDRIMELAAPRNIPVVEDAAQALGAVDRHGRALGTTGAVGCYSFFPSKNLGAFGDAGLVVTDDTELWEKMKLMRVHGAARAYMHEIVGGNFRIDALQAAVLRVKLPHLESWSLGRRANAELYRRLFQDRGLSVSDAFLPDRDHPVALPVEPEADAGGLHHIYNQFVVRALDRERLSAHLHAYGVGNAVYYPVPFHRQPCFEPWVDGTESFPVADRAASEVLALPVYPELSTEQIERVVDAIARFYAGSGIEERSEGVGARGANA